MKIFIAITLNAILLIFSSEILLTWPNDHAERKRSGAADCVQRIASNSGYSYFDTEYDGITINLINQCKHDYANNHKYPSTRVILFNIFAASIFISSISNLSFLKPVFLHFLNDVFSLLRLGSEQRRLKKSLKNQIEIATLKHLKAKG